MAKKRPGVMLYFDIRPALQRLSDEARGRLLTAIFDYGEFGVVPNFSDDLLAMAWDFIQPRIDADAEKYKTRCNQASSAAKKRWVNADGYERIQTDADYANSNHPQPISKPTSKPISTLSIGAASTGKGGMGEKPELDFENRRQMAMLKLKESVSTLGSS